MRADYVCLGPRCRTEDGSSPTYELPTGSTRCPKCGSRRLRQLFTNPNVIPRGAEPTPDMRLTSSSHLVRSTALLQGGFDEADKRKPPGDMRTWAMPARDAGGFLQGPGRPMDQLEIQRVVREDQRRYGRPTEMPSVLHTLSKTPIPTVAKRDPRGE